MQEQNENPREEPQTEAPKQAGEASGRDFQVMRRIRFHDTARAARATCQGSGHARVVAIRVLGFA